MHRYLLDISYMGTRFRGAQKTIRKSKDNKIDSTTVQGCLDLVLRLFRPINEIQTVLSSRTDAGVHALHSTVHVDLAHYSGKPMDTCRMTTAINRYFYKEQIPIRILNTRIVPDTFHCRYNAIGRTYIYRLAVIKTENSDVLKMGDKKHNTYMPIEEFDRCLFLQYALFDIERFKRVSQLFLGRHDFRTFMRAQKDKTRDHAMFAVRRIDMITITPGQSLAVGNNAKLAEELYTYWDIEIRGKSFVHNQVRRIIGAMIAVALDQLDEKAIYEMLTIPSKNSWNPRINVAPAFALYLSKIHYDEKDMISENKGAEQIQ